LPLAENSKEYLSGMICSKKRVQVEDKHGGGGQPPGKREPGWADAEKYVSTEEAGLVATPVLALRV